MPKPWLYGNIFKSNAKGDRHKKSKCSCTQVDVDKTIDKFEKLEGGYKCKECHHVLNSMNSIYKHFKTFCKKSKESTIRVAADPWKPWKTLETLEKKIIPGEIPGKPWKMKRPLEKFRNLNENIFPLIFLIKRILPLRT